jgi:hypothetical protein
MAELTNAQRQLLAQGLSRPTIPGSAPILQPALDPHYGFRWAYPELAGLPAPVAQAIAPNLGTSFGRKGDFVTGVNPPATNESDPTMMMNTPPPGDQSFERQGMPWWHGDRMLRRT